MRKVILYPGEDGYIVAECPSQAGLTVDEFINLL